MSFKFKITKEIFEVLPNAKVGGIYIYAIAAKPNSNIDIDSIKQNIVAEVIKRKDYINKSKTLRNWTKIWSLIGEDIGRTQPSHLSLFNRVLNKKEFISVNPLVDIYNIISLHKLIPIGGHNVNEINEIEITKSKGNEIYRAIGQDKDEVIDKTNEYIYFAPNNNKVLTRKLVWRQSDYSKIDENSKEIFIPIDDFLDVYSVKAIENIAKELVGLMSEFFDFKFKFSIANKYSQIIDFDFIDENNIQTRLPELIIADSNVRNSEPEVEKYFDRKLDKVYPTEEEFKQLLKSGKRLRFYMGADCSAPNLHIGHMIPLRKMSELQKLGHQIIFLIGDFTGRIGDPTDKSSVRKQLTPDEVAYNAQEFIKQASKVISINDEKNPVRVVYNSEWNDDLKFQDVIELSTNFTIQQMIERDMFQKRIKEEKPIFMHEFFYPMMQGYDSVYLEVDGEFGGIDQTFNMLAGRQMMKSIKGMDKFVITAKTLLSSDGVTKMSKSIGNCIFLTDSPKDKFGKVMAIPDNLIIHYFELVTNLADEEIESIKTGIENSTIAPMDAKKKLAYILVNDIDGSDAAEYALKYFESTIQRGEIPDDATIIKRSNLRIKGESLALKDVVVEIGAAKSNADAKRLISEGAVEINNTKSISIDEQFIINNINTIKIGKRRWYKFID